MTNVEYLLFSTFKICYDQVDDMPETSLKLRHYIVHTYYYIALVLSLSALLTHLRFTTIPFLKLPIIKINRQIFRFLICLYSKGKLVAYHIFGA